MIHHHSRGRGGPYIPPETWWGKAIMSLYFFGVLAAVVFISVLGWRLVINGWNIIGWEPTIWMGVTQIPLTLVAAMMSYLLYLTVAGKTGF